MWIKFLKAYETHKQDEILDVDEATAKSLISLKFAEETQSPETSILDKAFESFGAQLTKSIEGAVTAVVEKTTKAIETRITAMPNAEKDKHEARHGFKSFGEFVDAVVKGSAPTNPSIDARLKGTPSGQSVANDVEGGYLVPEDFAAGIWEFVNGEQSFMTRCDQRQTSGNNLNFNADVETSRKSGYRHSGIIAYWMDEADQYTSSTMKLRRMRLELHKLGVLSYTTSEELADAAIALGPRLQRKAGEAITFLVNESILFGTGAGQPLGIFRSGALITVDREAGQDDTIRHYNINKMFARLHPNLRNGAVWLMHPSVEEQMPFISFKDIVGATQVPVYLPPGNSIVGGPNGSLYGRPVIVSEFMKGPGAKGSIGLVNFSQYTTLTKVGGGITSAESIHVRFLYDERAFKFSFRIDGQPYWSTPLEDYNGTVTRSPFVTLASSGSGSSSGL